MWTGRRQFRGFIALLLRTGVQRIAALAYRLRGLWLVTSLATSTPSNNEVDSRDESKICGVLDSMTVKGPESEPTGVTAFVQEACEQVTVLGSHYHKPEIETLQKDIQDLKEYFRRPRMIISGTLNPGFIGLQDTMTVTNSSLFNLFFPQGDVRLTGAYGIRFRTVFTLQVATNPFHQGLLALSYQPTAGLPMSRTYQRSLSSATCTNLSHVRLDLSTTTMVQLEIPYISELEFMEIRTINNFVDLGLLALNVVLPVAVVAGILPPTYKLYVHLEDLELVGAFPEAVDVVLPQAGRVVKPMNKEFEDEAYPFSSSLSALSRSVRFIARGVPMISSIAGPTHWFLEKAAGAVRSFGFAKPQIQEPMHRVIKYSSALEHNVDVPSATVMVGPLAGNQLKVDPSFAFTDVDEMSLSYVLSRYSQICAFQMTTSDPTASVLYATNVSPSNFWFRRPSAAPAGNFPAPILSGATGNSFIPSHAFFFGSMFRFWRGSFKFRFTFAKTKLHGGRVMAVFVPGFENGTYSDTPGGVVIPDAGPSNLPQPFGQSAIFDLRDDSVFEFEVPYVAPYPQAQFNQTIGSLSLIVMDPLQAPSVVSDTVPFLVEVCCMPDFELSIPTSIKYPAHIQGSPTFQAGRIIPATTTSTDQLTTGECINSVKQLISLPKYGGYGTAAPGNVLTTASAFPWVYQPNISPAVPGPTSLPRESFGFGGNIASCYAFARGSTDVHVYAVGDQSKVSITAYASPGNLNATSAVSDVRNPSYSNIPLAVFLRDGVAHARFPAYQQTVRFNSAVYNATAWNSTFGATNSNVSNVTTGYGATPPIIPQITVRNSSADAVPIFMSRSAGDDAMLGHYMGPPPLVLTSTSAGALYDPDRAIIV